MSTDYQAIDYTTHILIGVRAGGVMTVLADWPYVPPASGSAERNRLHARALRSSRCARRRRSCPPISMLAERPSLHRGGRSVA